jgi:triosephosphate isomerase
MPKLLIANWKSNKNSATTTQWFQDFEAELQKQLAGQKLTVKVVIAPSFPLLALARQEIDALNARWKAQMTAEAAIELGVQDISQFGAGSYTGAVSGQNLAWLKPTTVILGHSERRHYFQETSVQVAAKYDQATDLSATSVVCVDRNQIVEQSRALGQTAASKVIVAYEPVEAIGTGKHTGLEQVKQVVKEIQTAFSPQTTVLYGGSVDELTINEYLLVTDGVIIGTASLDGTQFARVVAAAQSTPMA